MLSDAQLDLVFGALADRTRRAILARLAGREATVGELTAMFEMSQPAVSKHLRVLERAGLISRTQQGTARLSRLEAAPLQGATGWLADYREYWQERYDRLDDVLAALGDQDEGRAPDDPDPTRSREDRP